MLSLVRVRGGARVWCLVHVELQQLENRQGRSRRLSVDEDGRQQLENARPSKAQRSTESGHELTASRPFRNRFLGVFFKCARIGASDSPVFRLCRYATAVLA